VAWKLTNIAGPSARVLTQACPDLNLPGGARAMTLTQEGAQDLYGLGEQFVPPGCAFPTSSDFAIRRDELLASPYRSWAPSWVSVIARAPPGRFRSAGLCQHPGWTGSDIREFHAQRIPGNLDGEIARFQQSRLSFLKRFGPG